MLKVIVVLIFILIIQTSTLRGINRLLSGLFFYFIAYNRLENNFISILGIKVWLNNFILKKGFFWCFKMYYVYVWFWLSKYIFFTSIRLWKKLHNCFISRLPICCNIVTLSLSHLLQRYTILLHRCYTVTLL